MPLIKKYVIVPVFAYNGEIRETRQCVLYKKKIICYLASRTGTTTIVYTLCNELEVDMSFDDFFLLIEPSPISGYRRRMRVPEKPDNE